MVIRDVEPTIATLTSAISGLQRCGRPREALQVFDRVEGAGLEPDVVCYGAAMTAARASGQVGLCLTLAERMRDAGLTPNSHCLNEVSLACADLGSHTDCLSDEYRAAYRDRCRALVGDGQWRKAAQDFNVVLDATHGTAVGEGIFRDALSKGAYSMLEQPLKSWTLDLHGLSGGAARHAVEWWLTDVQSPLLQLLHGMDSKKAGPTKGQLIIITGKGKHRRKWQRSTRAPQTCVRASVESMLTEAKAPLRPSSNDGVLLLSIDTLADWGAFGRWAEDVKEHRQQEFVRTRGRQRAAKQQAPPTK